MKRGIVRNIVFTLAVSALLYIALPNIDEITAYFTDFGKADNHLTFGYNEIEIDEYFPDPGYPQAGETIVKEVSIKNTGANDCYVRIFADFNNSQMKEYCTIDWNTADFTYNSDGYWYYNNVLKSGKTTPDLMTKIVIADAIPGGFENFDLIVYAESVQAKGFATADDAWAFFNK